AEQAGAIRRQRLLAAIMSPEAVGVEGVEAGNGGIEHLSLAGLFDRADGGYEGLAVEGTPIAGNRGSQAQRLGRVGEANPLLKKRQVVAGDHQFMLRPDGV